MGRITYALIGLIVVMVAACANTPPVAPGTYISTEVEGIEMDDPTSITMRLGDDELSLDAGCNTIMGQADWEGNTLTLTDAVSTEMGCEPHLHDRDEFLIEQLSNGVTVEETGSELTVNFTGGAIVFEPQRDAPVEGTTWTIDGLVSQESVSSLPQGVSASLEIDDGEAHVDFGCNTGGGPVEVGEDTLTFGELLTTLKACEEDRMDVEDHVRQVLRGEVTYEVDGSTLTLSAGDNGLTLRSD
ncbi:MAG TPA: META domain-containing protein [Beutenbergiaceae bacterium]|nr:META domain-containing protein [Beutenbergiaceae bacterium]